MGNSVTVSFKLAPEHFVVLRAMAEGQDVSLSQFVRETVEGALDLDRQLERLADLFMEPERKLQG